MYVVALEGRIEKWDERESSGWGDLVVGGGAEGA